LSSSIDWQNRRAAIGETSDGRALDKVHPFKTSSHNSVGIALNLLLNGNRSLPLTQLGFVHLLLHLLHISRLQLCHLLLLQGELLLLGHILTALLHSAAVHAGAALSHAAHAAHAHVHVHSHTHAALHTAHLPAAHAGSTALAHLPAAHATSHARASTTAAASALSQNIIDTNNEQTRCARYCPKPFLPHEMLL
jgi:hypothetical protein